MNQSIIFRSLAIKNGFCLLVLAPIIFIACNSQSVNEGNKMKSDPAADTIPKETKSIKKILYHQIEKELLDKYLSNTEKLKQLTFKYYTADIHSSDIELRLVSYGLKENPAQPMTKDNLPITEGYYPTVQNTVYILGNNYLQIEALKAYVANYRSRLSYIKLIPQLSDKRGLEGQLVFTIKAFAQKGTDGRDGEELSRTQPKLQTDPSPPAPSILASTKSSQPHK